MSQDMLEDGNKELTGGLAPFSFIYFSFCGFLCCEPWLARLAGLVIGCNVPSV